MRNLIKRCLAFILILCILIPNVSGVVYADTAAQMTNSLITFAQKGTKLDVSNISGNELAVYGVFLSNFYIPGSTRIQDIAGTPSQPDEYNVTSRVSSVFFGNSSVSTDSTNAVSVQSLNQIVQNVAEDAINSGKGRLYTYLDNKDTSVSEPFTGQDLLCQIGNLPSTGYSVWCEENKNKPINDREIFSGYSKAWNAVMRTLFCVNPLFFMDAQDGLWSMNFLFIDAFGNIWGARGTIENKPEAKDYTLIVPACLNPCLWDNKYNVGNAFSIGMMSKTRLNNTDSLELARDGGKFLEPYMNLITNSKESAGRLVGIASPYDKLGENGGNISHTAIDDLIKSSKDTKPASVYEYLILDVDFSGLDHGNLIAYTPAAFKGSTSPGSKSSDSDYGAYSLDRLGNGVASSAIFSNLIDAIVLKKDGSNQDAYFDDYVWFDTNASLDTMSKLTNLKDIDLNDFCQTIGFFSTANSNGTSTLSQALSSPLLAVATDALEVSHDNAILENKVGVDTANDLLQMIKLADFDPNKHILNNRTKLCEYFTELSVSEIHTKVNCFGFASGAKRQSNFATNADETKLVQSGYLDPYYGFDKDDIKRFAIYKLFTMKDTIATNVSGAVFSGVIPYYSTGTDGKPLGATQYALFAPVANECNAWAPIYWTYMLKLLKINNNLSNIGKFDFPDLPTNDTLKHNVTTTLSNITSTVSGSSDVENTSEDVQKKLLSTVSDLLSDKPNAKRDGIFRAVLNGFLIDTHKSITGSRAKNIATGVNVNTSSSYSSAVGYISSPKLTDLPLTSWVIDNYTYIYIFLLLLILMTLFFMCLCNLRTWRQGVLLFIIMAFALILPQSLLNNAVIISNKFADAVFSDRFEYWAIADLQQANAAADLAAQTSTASQIVLDTMTKSSVAYDSGATGVKLKWMTPKKNSVFSSLFDDYLSETAAGANMTIFRWLFNSFFTGVEYETSDPFATYVHVTFNDIAKDAKKYYNNAVAELEVKLNGDEDTISIQNIRQNIKNVCKDGDDSNSLVIKSNLKFIGADYYSDNTNKENTYAAVAKKDEFGNTAFGDTGDDPEFNVHTGFGYRQNSQIIAVKAYSINDKANTSMLNGISTEKSVATFGEHSFNHRYWHLMDANVLENVFGKNPTIEGNIGLDCLDSSDGSSASENAAALQMFLAYTESPYYYFYNVLADRFAYGALSSGAFSFKQALLKDESFKYHKDEEVANGYMRDFLDLEGLFTTVIPVLYQSNLDVRAYTNTNGKDVETYNFEDTASVGANAGTITGGDDSTSDTDAASTAQSYTQAKERKDRLKRVWNMYCPWVDFMYELDVTNKKVKYAGGKVTVGDTLNPGSYDEVGRPMVYSEADMMAKHMKYTDLTDVERRIQNVQENTYKDLLYLINYYDFDDETLIATAAMFATFNFNKEFSGSKLLGNNATIYPQSFELKNFNYDAFLRLTLMNATGIPLNDTDTDLYQQILDKSSWWTGLFILIVDILACYAIPACKTLIMLLLLYLGLIFCITCVVQPPDNILKSLAKSILIPTGLYMLANMAFSSVVALMMGEGLVAYVGRKAPSMSMTDPTVTILMIILVSGVYLWALIKILMIVFKTFKSYGIGAALGIAGIAMGAVSGVANKAKRLTKWGVNRAFNVTDMKKAFGTNKQGSGDNNSGGKSNNSSNAKTGSSSNSGRSSNNSNRASVSDAVKDKTNALKKQFQDKASSFGNSVKKVAKQVKEDGVVATVGKAGVKVKHTVKNAVSDIKEGAIYGKDRAVEKGVKIGKATVKVAKKAVNKTKQAYDKAKKIGNLDVKELGGLAKSKVKANLALSKKKIAAYDTDLSGKRALKMNKKERDAKSKSGIANEKRAKRLGNAGAKAWSNYRKSSKNFDKADDKVTYANMDLARRRKEIKAKIK